MMNMRSTSENGCILDHRARLLIAIAVNSSTTHLDREGLRENVEEALEAGIPGRQVLEAMQLSSLVGMHTFTVGIPVLFDEMSARRLLDGGETVCTSEAEAMKRAFVADRGYWSKFLDQMLVLSPDLFREFYSFSSLPWKKGSIDGKLKELIYLATVSIPGHFYWDGFDNHLRGARNNGATDGEIVETLQIVLSLTDDGATPRSGEVREAINAIRATGTADHVNEEPRQ